MVTNPYRNKTEAALRYIIKDAAEAAQCMKSIGNYAAECKYLDQVNDASTELYRRRPPALVSYIKDPTV
jgi:hypothetical protein